MNNREIRAWLGTDKIVSIGDRIDDEIQVISAEKQENSVHFHMNQLIIEDEKIVSNIRSDITWLLQSTQA